jgi:hypothetical protein
MNWSTAPKSATMKKKTPVTQTRSASRPPTDDLDERCINTIWTKSIDAVQQANSGHPGMPMGIRRGYGEGGTCTTSRAVSVIGKSFSHHAP